MIQNWSGNVWSPAVERSRKANTTKTHNSFRTVTETFQMWSRACFIFAYHRSVRAGRLCDCVRKPIVGSST